MLGAKFSVYKVGLILSGSKLVKVDSIIREFASKLVILKLQYIKTQLNYFVILAIMITD